MLYALTRVQQIHLICMEELKVININMLIIIIISFIIE